MLPAARTKAYYATRTVERNQGKRFWQAADHGQTKLVVNVKTLGEIQQVGSIEPSQPNQTTNQLTATTTKEAKKKIEHRKVEETNTKQRPRQVGKKLT